MPTEEEGGRTQETPGPHPEPPQDLYERQPSVTESFGPWVRLYPVHLGPIYFGKDPALAGRFSAPNGEYGVLYAAEDEFGAFIERFGNDTGIRVVDEVDILERGLARIEVQRTFRLIDLTGAGLARIGADSRLFAADHSVARRWSAALRKHPVLPDGIRYPCRHDPSRTAVAFYDHICEEISATALGTMLSTANRKALAEILRTYGFGLT